MAQTTLNADFAEDVDNSGGEFPADGADAAGYSASPVATVRTCWRFNVTTIPDTNFISLVELIVNVRSVASAGSQSWYVGPYGGDATGDPSADAGSTAYSRCEVSGDNYGSYTDFRTTGSKTITLGAPATVDLAACLSGNRFTLACRQVDEGPFGVDTLTVFDEFGSANPPQLRVTHFPGSAPISAIHARRMALLGILGR